jgi:hypothetical protein
MSFSGQGHQIWQNPSNSATTARSFASTGSTARVNPLPPNRILPPFRVVPVYIYPGYGFYGFNPFFGLGFGYGFGGSCDPFNTWGFGCAGYPGYGYGFGYGYNNGYAYGGYGNGYPPNWGSVQSDSGSDDYSQEPNPSQWQNPPSDFSGAQADNSANPTVIYLLDGSSFAVSDYWVADGQLHYVTSYGGANSVDLKMFDVQRTTDENASNGIAVTLRNSPSQQAPQDQAPPAPARQRYSPAPDSAPPAPMK